MVIVCRGKTPNPSGVRLRRNAGKLLVIHSAGLLTTESICAKVMCRMHPGRDVCRGVHHPLGQLPPPPISDKEENMPTKYVHTNLVAKDWRRLAVFYREAFACLPVPPERDLFGEWLDGVTGIRGAHIFGMHLRLPGWGDEGPTLEIFQYGSMPEHPPVKPNTPGFSHIAFAVDDVAAAAQTAFDHGGSAVGELTVREVPGVGLLTVQYVADPEGNIIELQNWKMKRRVKP